VDQRREEPALDRLLGYRVDKELELVLCVNELACVNGDTGVRRGDLVECIVGV
jgi:hypothetical protein